MTVHSKMWLLESKVACSPIEIWHVQSEKWW